MPKQSIWGEFLKLILLPLLVAGFVIFLFPTGNNTNWVNNQATLVNTVNTPTQFSTTFSSKLAEYCIDQLGALETTSHNQHPSTFTKDQREVIPPLSSQEITSYNRLFFAQSEEIIDPDGRLCKGAKDSAVDMVSGGFKLAGNVAGSGMYGVSSGFGNYQNGISDYFNSSWQDLQSTGTGVMSLGSQLYHGNFGEIGTALTGGADKSIGYRIGYTGTTIGSFFVGGELLNAGKAGKAAELVEGLGEAGEQGVLRSELVAAEESLGENAPLNTANKSIVPRGRALEIQGGEIGEEKILDQAEKYLGSGYEEASPGRYLSEDGSRQFRYGSHETRNLLNHHAHFESLENGRVIENSVVKIIPYE